MTAEYCYGGLCFVRLSGSTPKFFGFSEFLAGLALMVLAWTIADVRYRFRVRIAPLPLQRITFIVVLAVGMFTLLTDLWRAQQWMVPKGNLVTPAEWQAFLGGVFFVTFLTWAWFAFIRPPVYGRGNAARYAHALYRFILRGSPSELSVIADELISSARSLVRYASDMGGVKNYKTKKERTARSSGKPAKAVAYANDILLLIANRRFCRVIVESSPGTALAIFQGIGEIERYGVQVGVFARNIVTEALANKDSFLFHEESGYQSGLMGYHKPLSRAMFSNYRMVEAIGTLLDPDIWEKAKWDSAQWKAYCRIALMTFRDYVKTGMEITPPPCTGRQGISRMRRMIYTNSTACRAGAGMTIRCGN